jgi:hypothetical protein
MHQKIVLASFLASLILVGCARETAQEPTEANPWTLESVEGGYEVVLPGAIVERLRDGDLVELSLVDDVRGETHVSGDVEVLSSTRLFVETDGMLAFTDRLEGTSLHLSGIPVCRADGDHGEVAGACAAVGGGGGCPRCDRNPALYQYNMNPAICVSACMPHNPWPTY